MITIITYTVSGSNLSNGSPRHSPRDWWKQCCLRTANLGQWYDLDHSSLVLRNLPTRNNKCLSAFTTTCVEMANWTHDISHHKVLSAVVSLLYCHNLVQRYWTPVSGNPLVGSTRGHGPAWGDFQITVLCFANWLKIFFIATFNII